MKKNKEIKRILKTSDTDKLSNNAFGFTIIELLVVVGITALLSGMIITYTSTGRRQVDLRTGAAELGQTISRAKSFAISTYNEPDIPCGYGVSVDYDNGAFDLFSYRPPDCSSIGTIDPSFINIIQSSDLPSGINYQTSPPSSQLKYILFIPPDPRTVIWDRGLSTTTFANVYLETADESAKLEVEVSVGGQISF